MPTIGKARSGNATMRGLVFGFGLFIALMSMSRTARVYGDDHQPSTIEATIDFATQIRPILSDACFHCHGPDTRNNKAGLRLDTPEGAFGTTELGGIAVVPGDLEASEMYWRITAEDDFEVMPPPEANRTLKPEEIALLTRWIEQGAPWEEHWAFRAPEPVEVAEVNTSVALSNPIDRFVEARRQLEAPDLPVSPPASREALIRRLAFDLTGLPPTAELVARFVDDDRPDANQRLIDRLLGSPAFGERMAVEWLDLARYADTYGYQADVYRAVWPYRDWVVRAYNTNMPYDQFVTWQLAGDLLGEPTRDQRIATAFNRLHRQTNEGGSVEEEFRIEYVSDRVNTFATTFLGLTMECARCHDHKYDPLSQREYYQFSAFFDNIDESGLYSHFTDAVPTPTLLLTDADQDRRIAAIESEIAEAESHRATLISDRESEFQDWLERGGDLPATDEISDRLARFDLDEVSSSRVIDGLDSTRHGTVGDGITVIPGRLGSGSALALDGESPLVLPLGNFTRNDPFTIAAWIRADRIYDRAVVFHRSRAWTDAGSRGYQLLIERGHLSTSLIHFWPGNAVRVRAIDPLPVDRWVHVAWTYDGSSRASGLMLYLDGRPVELEVVRDKLTKNITGGGGDELTFGQRFRDRGFVGGRVDQIEVFTRALSPLEVARLHGDDTLDVALVPADPGCDRDPASVDALRATYFSAVDPVIRDLEIRLHHLRSERSRLVDPIPELMVMEELPEPRPTYLLDRGSYETPSDPVAPETPAVLGLLDSNLPRNRLGLAYWLTDPENPLTSRVAVNRIWSRLMGRGLVVTPEDFGSQGAAPTHPELLDWLACRFVDDGWDVKRLVRLIVNSSTYQRSIIAEPRQLRDDPENRWLSRANAGRLPAEMVRDAALAASGLLVPEIGGPPVKPFQPAGLWQEKSGKVYRRDPGADSHRRTLYTYWKRTSPPPALLTFDAAKRDVCLARRQPTATPLQALVLLNDPQYIEAATVLAAETIGQVIDDDARIVRLTRTLWGRLPDDRERAIMHQIVREQRVEFASEEADPNPYLTLGDLSGPTDLEPAELAAWTALTQALMNHHDAVVRP